MVDLPLTVHFFLAAQILFERRDVPAFLVALQPSQNWHLGPVSTYLFPCHMPCRSNHRPNHLRRKKKLERSAKGITKSAYGIKRNRDMNQQSPIHKGISWKFHGTLTINKYRFLGMIWDDAPNPNPWNVGQCLHGRTLFVSCQEAFVLSLIPVCLVQHFGARTFTLHSICRIWI